MGECQWRGGPVFGIKRGERRLQSAHVTLNRNAVTRQFFDNALRSSGTTGLSLFLTTDISLAIIESLPHR